MGVELLSPINIRLYPETTLANCSRYAKIQLPEEMTSLLNTMKFQTDYYSCIYNGQLKVCFLCYASYHLLERVQNSFVLNARAKVTMEEHARVFAKRFCYSGKIFK